MDSVAKKGYDTIYPQNFVKPFSFNEEDDKQIQIAGGETCNTFYPGIRTISRGLNMMKAPGNI